ncbi:MAG: hypothetical protein L0Z53_06495, partial [Acidobacteriales bacterium]|nr:hypothetical protein [Terriglobales bacterium]
MARLEDIAWAATRWTIVVTGTNSSVTALRAAPAAGKRNYIVGFSISASAAPTAAVTARVRSPSGSTTLDQFEIPAAAFAPPIVVNYVRPLEGADGESVDLNLPALGASVTGTVV